MYLPPIGYLALHLRSILERSRKLVPLPSPLAGTRIISAGGSNKVCRWWAVAALSMHFNRPPAHVRLVIYSWPFPPFLLSFPRTDLTWLNSFLCADAQQALRVIYYTAKLSLTEGKVRSKNKSGGARGVGVHLSQMLPAPA